MKLHALTLAAHSYALLLLLKLDDGTHPKYKARESSSLRIELCLQINAIYLLLQILQC